MADGSAPLANARWERFACVIGKGKTDQGTAYTEAGYKSKSPEVEASKLLRKPKVAARVAYLKQKAAEKTTITLARVLDGLLTEASRDGDGSSHGARVSAWKALGEHLGAFLQRQEISGPGGQPIQQQVAEGLTDGQRERLLREYFEEHGLTLVKSSEAA